MNNKVGRPSNRIQARESLILAARDLFSRMPYEKVSIRLIADRSGVSSALIKYYFDNKFGLFETMIVETFQPISLKMRTARNKEDFDSLASVLRTFYQTMIQHPDYARLLYRVLTGSDSVTQKLRSEKIIDAVYVSGSSLFFNNINTDRPSMDTDLLRLSFFSLMYFPFLASEGMMTFNNFEMTPEFLQRLAAHNIELLKRSLLD
ncbi:DNA-binding transcriptional regulator, AcrR family [Ferrimonas sediminum]|uniref:DNA-binding transcriptional regulator, AcrR family n=1 Tax=Ferrimonas sediminum TaxID=718193 RepID=A0A1G8TRI0_9GAMM|nr:TetR/AcrR family transcriptional regulator [Ferrimonas sediminum]SDJ43310.1 DNA-binding transcriptional regulator, AcrR family [Ferrimonas sediminum]